MTIPTDGMIITGDVQLTPGVYFLPAGLTIAADNLTLDGNNALLIGAGRQGRGVFIEHHNNITIKNLRIAEYYHGIYAHACHRLTILDCQVTSTAETFPNTEFHDIWKAAGESSGGGILFWEVSDGTLMRNTLMHQMTGMYAYGCNRLSVLANNASFCSAWGFHLYQTCDSTYEDNIADYCCNWESRGQRTGHMGADAAGFLIVHSSCRNMFRRNLARMGGDGFFLAGMTPGFELVGCNDNLFVQNDGSWSPNIAFEATFSRRNVFRDNYANCCNYGFWLGFSRDGELDGNLITDNRRAGIAVENGVNFLIRENTFRSNSYGILLWSKRIPDFELALPENNTSHDWNIERNQFIDNSKAIRVAADQDHGIRPLPTSGKLGYPAPVPHDHIICRNILKNNDHDFEFIGVVGTTLEQNGEAE